jgi:heme exporter protein D
MAKARLDISRSKEFKLHELAMLSLSPIVRSIQRWWLQRAEKHYLICADVEQQRAREAQMNVAYYQKQAALARSARH